IGGELEHGRSLVDRPRRAGVDLDRGSHSIDGPFPHRRRRHVAAIVGPNGEAMVTLAKAGVRLPRAAGSEGQAVEPALIGSVDIRGGEGKARVGLVAVAPRSGTDRGTWDDRQGVDRNRERGAVAGAEGLIEARAVEV